MKPGNPACYECPKGRANMHHWRVQPDDTLKCDKCELQLTKAQSDDVLTTPDT